MSLLSEQHVGVRDVGGAGGVLGVDQDEAENHNYTHGYKNASIEQMLTNAIICGDTLG